MSTDPNILAAKHTPGEWKFVRQAHATKKSGLGLRYGVMAKVLNHLERENDKWLFNISLDKTEDIQIHQEAEANAHVISAAPEAIEFIADLMPVLEELKCLFNEEKYQAASDQTNLIIARAEGILKKAYNF